MEVQLTDELLRVSHLPRRQWSDTDVKTIHAQVDAFVRRPGGRMSLFYDQAIALYELSQARGLFNSLEVGGGKTLPSFLAPIVLNSSRPLLLIPAALKEKTLGDQRKYSEHFKVPNYLNILSYELLGRVTSATRVDEHGHTILGILDSYKPDVIIADEGHFLRNERAAVTRRVMRYRRANPHCRFILLSGTIGDSLLDYAHLMVAALGEGAPVPRNDKEITSWAKHLDAGSSRIDPGALLNLCNDEELRQNESARNGFRRRVADTLGVVSASDMASDDDYKGSLWIDFDRIAIPDFLSEQLAKIRKGTGPNGEEFDDPLEIHRHVREMALGFFYYWDPPPPKDWLEIRRRWSRVSRKILTTNRRNLDSPLQVTNAVDRGLYVESIICGDDEEGIHPVEALAEWRRVKTTYEYKTIPAWISTFLVEHIAAKVKSIDPTIIWVNQTAFGNMLANASGLPYYAQKGIDQKTGASIEADKGGRSIIASIHSNRRGRNLQDRWARNYYVDPPPNEERIEQSLGRTHRKHQLKDRVEADIAVTCLEHEFAIQRAIAQARVVKQTQGHTQKLLKADFLKPFTYAEVEF